MAELYMDRREMANILVNENLEMMAYCQIVNMIDNIASHGRAATEGEISDIKSLAKEYGIEIDSFADANDCGNCFTWEEIIGAFRCLWASGERV